MIREIKNNHLYFDGCDTVKLAEKYGTPLYVLSYTDILNKIGEVKKSFLDRHENTRAAYAAKAFCTLAMLKIVEKEGLCLDVVSGGELYTAIQAGFPAERIEFNGNNKQPAELEMAIDYGIGRLIIDGLQELKLIESICAKKQKKAKVLYRITPGVMSDTHEYITTGKKDSKFGIPLDEAILYPAVKAAIESEWVDFLGIHFHVGSQIFDNAYHLSAVDVALDIMKEIRRRFDFTIQELNYGGGFGIQYTGADERQSYAYFMDPIMEKTERFCAAEGFKRPAIVIEPGRSIVGEGGMTLYTVGSIKEIPGVRKYVNVDGGMTDNIRVGLYQAKYEGMLANKASEKAVDKVSIAGKCCESTDILIQDIEIPESQAGDIFAVFSTGAYGYSMANNYNKALIPAVVLVKEGRDALIVKRQSYEQLIQNEQMPDLIEG